MKFLRQNTATVIDVGPILGTDFLTVQTGLALATGHAELYQAGATASIDISARAFSHIAGGVYQLSLLTTDLGILGPLLINLHIASSAPLAIQGNVLSQKAYDALCGGGNMMADIQAVFGSANSATQLSNAASAIQTITVGNGAATNLVPTNLSSSVTAFYAGRTLIFVTGALAGQAASITGYNGATKQLTTSQLTSAPSPGDTAVIV